MPTITWTEPWSAISPPDSVRPGTPVTAVWATYDSAHLDLFAVGADGAVKSSYWDQATGWHPWFDIGPAHTALPGTAVTAVWAAYNPTGHLDLFTIGGPDGSAVQSTYWEPATGWHPWFEIAQSSRAGQGATMVNAVWAPHDSKHLDLFYVDVDGQVHSTFWEVDKGWQSWFPIGPPGTIRPESSVTSVWASYLPAGHLDLFGTSPEGLVQSTYWEATTGWRPWFSIDLTKQQPPTARVTAFWAVYNPTGHLDLFLAGIDGQVQSTYWEPDTGWEPWSAIGPPGTLPPAAPVTATWAHGGPDHDLLALFGTSANGEVRSSQWENRAGWQPWSDIPQTTTELTPGETVTAVWHPNSGHLDLFTADADGTIWTTYGQVELD
jgi:hypothetical protein